jgi:hypothetical protein
MKKCQCWILFLPCIVFLLSCETHTCFCTEYTGTEITDQYEKKINNSSTCESMNDTVYDKIDTTIITCGETNPLQ